MPISRGTVKSCRKNRKGFQLDDGNWYSRMKGDELPVEEWRNDGVTIEVDWFQEGNWKNFTKDPTVIQEETSEPEQAAYREQQLPAPAAKGFGSTKSFAKKTGGAGGYRKEWHAYEDYDWQVAVSTRIARQSALDKAATLVSSLKVDADGAPIQDLPTAVDMVTTVANLFLAWVESGSE